MTEEKSNFKLNKKCEMCCAQVTIAADGLSAQCEFCGHKYTYKIPVTENVANEIAHKRFANLYKKAMREVDISAMRTKNAGREYAKKAEEMGELGDYRNAAHLALKYEKKAEFYIVEEEKEKNRKKKLDVYKIIISLVAAVPGVFVTIEAWQSSGNTAARILSITAMAFLFAVSIIYATLNKANVLFRNKNDITDFFLNTFDKYLYGFNILIWIIIIFIVTFIPNERLDFASIYSTICILLIFIVMTLAYKQKNRDLAEVEETN